MSRLDRCAAPRMMMNPATQKGNCSGRSVATLLLYVALLNASLFAQGTNDLADGVQLLNGGHFAEARVKFDAAIKQAPTSPDALTWRGICENQLEQYSAAAADFNAALRLNSTMFAARYNLALSLIRLHKTDAAIEQLRIVIAAKPDVVQPLYNLAILLEANGSFPEAAARLSTAHTLAPADKGVTLHLLGDNLKLTHPTEDLAALIANLEDNSTPPEIQRQAGAALLEAARFSDAVLVLKWARDQDPHAPEIDLLLARALLGNQQNAEAVELLEAAAAADRANEEKTYLLALAYLGQGNMIKATASFEAAARLDPHDARPLYHLGLLAAAKPQGEAQALLLLRSAHTLAPDNSTYTFALARLLLAIDQAADAKSILVQAKDADSDDAQRLTLLGVAMAANHEIPEAILQLKNALTRNPSIALAQNVLGFCFLEQGNYAQAAEAYGQASKLEPKRSRYARDAALAYERANQPQQALSFAELANTLDGSNAGDHALLGKLYAAAGRNQDAVRELLQTVALNPDLDLAFYLLARTYQQLGDRQQANEWSVKLSALKQKHEASFNLQKRAAATDVRSSMLLEGGSSGSVEAEQP